LNRGRARELLPDVITIARLPLAVVFPFVVERPAAAIATLLAAGASDVLDGWCARTLGTVTATGAKLDVFADKAFAGSVVVSLVAAGKLSLAAAALLGTREIGELLLLGVAATRRRGHHAVVSSPAGKLTTTLEFAVVGAVILGWSGWRPLLVATGVCGAIATVGYWMQALRAEGQ
jgi:CDP-diacylglycerol--glycerol-3-phosphate 3-phosphatidyltransferase/cardiolipin synthase